MNIAVLTSGGDAPGMNALISNVVSLAEESNHKVFAFRCGYQGLVENDILRLTSDLTDNIFHLGGSYIMMNAGSSLAERSHCFSVYPLMRI